MNLNRTRLLMRNRLSSYAALVLAAAGIGACGELTGPESPTTPSGVVATLASPTSVTVSWTPSPLSDGVINYIIYRNGDRVGQTQGLETTFTDTGLTPQTTYVYSVAANCVGGVESRRSAETEQSTVTTRDVTPPTVVQTIPVPGATQASPSADVNAIFSEPMDPATINATTLTLRVTNGQSIAGTVTYNAETRRATLVPSAPLPNPANFTATVTTGAKDLAGNALAAPHSWTFTTRDDTPPTVVATSPANGATGVVPTVQVTISFNEAMDAATVNAANITIRQSGSGTALTSVVTYNTATRVATLTPSAPLAQSTSHTVTVGTGVRDAAGNAIAQTSFSFTVGDLTAPTVVSTVPADGATGVATNATISATFSEPMDPMTISTTTFTVRPTAGGSNIAGTVTYNGGTNTATFTPSAALAGGTQYTATVTTGARDAAGNPMATARSWSFTTIDTTPPAVASVTPANNATNVPVNSTIAVRFSEPMDAATITTANINVRNTATSAQVAGTISYDPVTNTATFAPGGLSFSTNYTVTVTTGVRDVAGNALASQVTSTFTTTAAPDNTPPIVVSRTPANGATSVAVNTNITVTFSEPMDPSTITSSTITLTPTEGGSAVAATVTYSSGTNTATLDPTSDLANNTSYTITVTTGVKDVAGNALAANSLSTFTTIPDTIAPTVIARTPTASSGVPRNTTVTVTFSEPMDPATINGTTFALATTVGSIPVTGSVSYNAATRIATFTPSGNLAATTSYTATVTTGARDLAGNPLTGNFSFSFTTAP